jgi:hypothetical protein
MKRQRIVQKQAHNNSSNVPMPMDDGRQNNFNCLGNYATGNRQQLLQQNYGAVQQVADYPNYFSFFGVVV